MGSLDPIGHVQTFLLVEDSVSSILQGADPWKADRMGLKGRFPSTSSQY